MPPADDRHDRERLKAIELAVGQIEKQFGKGSIMRLGQKDAIAMMPSISTGSVSLDYALGIGGVPRGRVVEIFGPESSGKTTLSLQVIAEAQKLGGMAAFVDAEHALDAQYARKLGVDLDNLLVSQPDNGEQALEIVEVLVRSGGVDVVVVDSVAALVPRAEIEGEMGEAQMGLQARLMSQALRKLTGVVSKSKTCLIFINQLREKIGVMFGNPETTTGGRALKFYCLGPHRHPADRRDQGRRRRRRRPDPGEGRQEQGRAAVPRGGVRRDVRRRHLEGRRPARPGGRAQDRREERHMVRLRWRAPRSGPREREAVPEGQPGDLQVDRGEGAARARDDRAMRKSRRSSRCSAGRRGAGWRRRRPGPSAPASPYFTTTRISPRRARPRSLRATVLNRIRVLAEAPHLFPQPGVLPAQRRHFRTDRLVMLPRTPARSTGSARQSARPPARSRRSGRTRLAAIGAADGVAAAPAARSAIRGLFCREIRMRFGV